MSNGIEGAVSAQLASTFEDEVDGIVADLGAGIGAELDTGLAAIGGPSGLNTILGGINALEGLLDGELNDEDVLAITGTAGAALATALGGAIGIPPIIAGPIGQFAGELVGRGLIAIWGALSDVFGFGGGEDAARRREEYIARVQAQLRELADAMLMLNEAGSFWNDTIKALKAALLLAEGYDPDRATMIVKIRAEAQVRDWMELFGAGSIYLTSPEYIATEQDVIDWWAASVPAQLYLNNVYGMTFGLDPLPNVWIESDDSRAQAARVQYSLGSLPTPGNLSLARVIADPYAREHAAANVADIARASQICVGLMATAAVPRTVAAAVGAELGAETGALSPEQLEGVMAAMLDSYIAAGIIPPETDAARRRVEVAAFLPVLMAGIKAGRLELAPGAFGAPRPPGPMTPQEGGAFLPLLIAPLKAGRIHLDQAAA